MQLLFADPLPARRSPSSRRAGTPAWSSPRSAGSDLAGPDRRVRRPGGAQHQGRRRRVRGRRPAGAGDPRRGGHEHHRHRRRRRPRRAGRPTCPGRNAAAVAELTMGLLLAIDRRIADNVADLRGGRWDKKALQQGRRAARRRRMGIIGLGSIGLVRGRAGRGVRHPGPGAGQARAAARTSAARAEELGITMCDIARGAARRPPTSCRLHVPVQRGHQAPGRRRRSSAGCGPARSCSTPRAATSSTRTRCCEALDAGAVRAGLDVFADEPGSGTAEWDSALAQHPHVVGTHHIGASTAAGPARHRRRRGRDRRRVRRRRGAQLREPRTRAGSGRSP